MKRRRHRPLIGEVPPQKLGDEGIEFTRAEKPNVVVDLIAGKDAVLGADDAL